MDETKLSNIAMFNRKNYNYPTLTRTYNPQRLCNDIIWRDLIGLRGVGIKYVLKETVIDVQHIEMFTIILGVFKWCYKYFP